MMSWMYISLTSIAVYPVRIESRYLGTSPCIRTPIAVYPVRIERCHIMQMLLLQPELQFIQLGLKVLSPRCINSVIEHCSLSS